MNAIKLNDFPLDPAQDQVYEIIPDKSKIVSSTNRLFNKYPTRYISAVPRYAINAFSIPGDTVLDPFCGSGTTAIEAMLLGRNAVSIDIDPFARLLIKAKTHIYSAEDIELINSVVDQMKTMSPTSQHDYRLPGIPNIDKWFCDHSKLWLSFFKDTIDKLASDNDAVKNYLYVVLAGIIRKSSNADEVSPKPYISTKYPKTPADPSVLFYKTEQLYRDAIIDYSTRVEAFGCTSIVLDSKDARKIDTDIIVDLAVTSPPYINAYDYVRSLRFEDIWLDLASETELRESRKDYIGTEVSSSFYQQYKYASQSELLMSLSREIEEVDAKRANIIKTYFEDMAVNMLAVADKLKKKGKYVIVVGDSNIRGQTIPTAKVLTDIATKNGYEFELSFKYVIRDRYLHLPRGNRGGIINFDEILVLTKA